MPGQKPTAATHLFPPGQKLSFLEGQRSHVPVAGNSDLGQNRKPHVSQNSVTRQVWAARSANLNTGLVRVD